MAGIMENQRSGTVLCGGILEVLNSIKIKKGKKK
jgi:hypothetical protein